MEYFYIENELTKNLDEVYEGAKKGIYKAPLFSTIGLSESGKTSKIRAWLKHNNHKFIEINALTLNSEKYEFEYLPIDEINGNDATIIGKNEMTELLTPKKREVNVIFSSDIIDKMDKDTIVLIDNYDKAIEEIRLSLFQLLKKLLVTDSRVNNVEKLRRVDALMFIVVLDTMKTMHEDVLTKEEKALLGINE